MTKNILIAEDDEDIVGLLRLYLEKDGYKVISVDNGEDAFKIVKNSQISLALLDIMMPKMNGYELTKKIREITNIPIIILSAKTLDSEKILGLDLGADDYLTKPFAIEELLARIRVALKRRGTSEVHTHRIEIRGVCMDTDRHEVTVGGEIVELTNREFELLRTLMENKDIVMDREKLLNAVCGYDYLGETNIIDVYVRYLRTKIDDRFGVKLITTVRGVGYVIRE